LNLPSLRRYITSILLATILNIIGGCDSFGNIPSDAALQERFLRNEAEYVRLVQMSDQDRHVTVIKDTFTYLDTDASWPREDIGFRRERWDEYRGMFRKLGIEGGLSRRTDYPSTVFIVVYGRGGVLASSEKGFVYSQKPLSPIVQSLDVYPPTVKGGTGHAIGFKALANSWYMYREEY
jgi:hypothetical protein